MLFGPSTSNQLFVVASVAGSLRVTKSVLVFTDATPAQIIGADTESDPLPAITSTTPVALVTGVASKCKRLINSVIRNDGATANDVTLRHQDGTDTVDFLRRTLLVGETLEYDGARWAHKDTQGGEYTYSGPATPNLGSTNTLAETIPRELCPEVNTTGAASGTLFLQAIYLKAGTLVSNITVWSATTAAGTPTNQFFALYDASRNLLAQSANATTGAWAANSAKTLAMTTPYRVPVSGLYYIGIMVTATTVPTYKGGTAKTGGQLAAAAPILHGTSTTGLTTTLPNPAAAITGGTASIYAAVS